MLGLYPAPTIRAAEEVALSSVPPGTLMQRASFGLAVECSRLLRDVTGGVYGSEVTILVGSGNNGGDALFAGAMLQRRGARVHAIAVADRWHEAGVRALTAAGGRVTSGVGNSIGPALAASDLVLDGIVGIGASGGLREPFDAIVTEASSAPALRVAVDIPSGVDPDDGTVPGGNAFAADVTVTFGCAKPGLFRMPGARYAGAVRIVDIGLDDALPEPEWRVFESIDALEFVAEPAVGAYKYSRGVVGVVAGSPRYPGAALLAVGGARYSGVGMTTILDRADDVASDVVRAHPDVVTVEGDPRSLDRIGAWACGPGLVGDGADAHLVGALLDSPVPVVLDAGALSAVADHQGLQEAVRDRSASGRVTVLTPHAGEYRRLLADAPAGATDLRSWGAVVVRKGPATLVEDPSGGGFVDAAGTADLACAGSGDVLAGLIAGMLAGTRDCSPVEVVAAAVWLHGMAGRCAARDDRPILATDLVRALPIVVAGARRGRMPC